MKYTPLYLLETNKINKTLGHTKKKGGEKDKMKRYDLMGTHTSA